MDQLCVAICSATRSMAKFCHVVRMLPYMLSIHFPSNFPANGMWWTPQCFLLEYVIVEKVVRRDKSPARAHFLVNTH